MELAAEMVFDLLGGCLEEVVDVRGARVDSVMDPCTVLGVIVGAEEGLPVTNAFDCGEGVAAVALSGLRGDYFVLVLVLVLNRDGDVVGEVMPVGLDVVLKRLAMDVDAGVGGRLGDIAGESVGDVFKWNDGEGISVTDCTVYDLRVREETS
jgi:hypothetical protein